MSQVELDLELFDEDREKFYENTLFSAIDDCCYCPFREDGEEDEFCDHSGNPNSSPPCESANYNYKGMTIQEVIDNVVSRRRSYEDYLDRQYEKEQKEKEKKAKAAEKRRQTKWENWDLDNEIKRLRKSIASKEAILHFGRSLSSALAFADNMMYNKPIPEKTEKHPFELDIEVMEQRILEIKAEKKERAKVRRKNQKEVK